MSRGNILYGLAAIVVIVCFFLPWLGQSAGGMSLNFSGWQLATGPKFMGQKVADGVPVFFIILAAAVIGLILAGLAFTRALPRRFAGVLAILLGAAILVILFWKLADWKFESLKLLKDYAQYGLWATIGGAAVKIIGGLIDLF